MATHFRILAWRVPWTGVPGGLQSMGSQRVGRVLPTKFPTPNIRPELPTQRAVGCVE